MSFLVVMPDGKVEKLSDIVGKAPYTLDVNLNYFQNILAKLSDTGVLKGLTVFITRKTDTVPKVGKDVLVLQVGDEWCRFPDYVNDVKAVIKCYGVSPAPGYTFHKNFNRLQFLSLLNNIRIMKFRMPSMIKNGLQNSNRKKILHIPLGYYKQEEVDWIPLNKREIDVYFAGSLDHNAKKSWLRQLCCSPKTVSREQMIAEAQRFSADNPEFRTQIDLLETFLHADEISKYPYSERLMNSKICLVPRGTSFETFRFFEAIRSGCIVICEDLPNTSFYDDAPVYRLYDWKELHNLLPKLLNNPEFLKTMHAKSLDWWESRCSESAVVNMIHSHLEKLR